MPKAATMNSENMAVETVPGAKEDEVKVGGGCGPGQSPELLEMHVSRRLWR